LKKVKVRAVIIHGPNGYTMHGSHDLLASDMFKMLSGVWTFNPEKETVHYVEVDVKLPEYEVEIIDLPKIIDNELEYLDSAYGWEKVS